jgi:hypothetical protein
MKRETLGMELISVLVCCGEDVPGSPATCIIQLDIIGRYVNIWRITLYVRTLKQPDDPETRGRAAKVA